MAKRWTTEETRAWLLHFAGMAPRPDGRDPETARTRLRPPPISDLSSRSLAHATSMAAMRRLSSVPYRHDGDQVAFVEAVQSVAMRPWADGAESRWPTGPFRAAVKEAREAVIAETVICERRGDFYDVSGPAVFRAAQAIQAVLTPSGDGSRQSFGVPKHAFDARSREMMAAGVNVLVLEVVEYAEA